MKVRITNDFTLDELKSKIEKDFPDYKTSFRGKNILVVKKNGTTAALVLGGKNGTARVNEGFPTMGGQMIFTFSLILLGILIPLIIYFTVFFPAQKSLRNEIADYIKKNYGDGSAQGLKSEILDQK